MSKEDLKRELHKLIDEMEDESILNILQEDLETYGKDTPAFNDLSDLSIWDRKELEELTNEDQEKNTINYERFQKIMEEWRLQLLQKRGSKTA